MGVIITEELRDRLRALVGARTANTANLDYAQEMAAIGERLRIAPTRLPFEVVEDPSIPPGYAVVNGEIIRIVLPVTVNSPSPVREYRMVNEGEIIEETDEFLEDDCKTWSRIGGPWTRWGVGMVWSEHGYIKPLRRPLGVVQAEPAVGWIKVSDRLPEVGKNKVGRKGWPVIDMAGNRRWTTLHPANWNDQADSSTWFRYWFDLPELS